MISDVGIQLVCSLSLLSFICKFRHTKEGLYEVDRTFSQVEYMIIALLLKRSGLEALVVAFVVGTILFGIPLFVPDCKCNCPQMDYTYCVLSFSCVHVECGIWR
jgi:hypothetical protein